MKRFFTLIELIVVIVVLGILAAIVIPNISSFKGDATKTAIESNTRNIQTAVDMQRLDGEFLPIGEEGEDTKEVILGNPKKVNFDKLDTKYLRDKPKQGNYWIDSNNIVYGSTTDAPPVGLNIVISAGSLTWTESESASLYQVYGLSSEVTSNAKGGKLVKIGEPVKTNNYEGSEIKEGNQYFIALQDEYGNWTPPFGGKSIDPTPVDMFIYEIDQNSPRGYVVKGFSENYDGRTEIIIPDEYNNLPVKEIGRKAFLNKGLTRVKFGDNLKDISTDSFNGNNLTNIIIPDSVESISTQSFINNKIEYLKIGKGVKWIGNNAFENNKLNEVIIPDNVLSINSKAFYGNEITNVTIGKGLTKLQSQLFTNNKLTKVIIPDNITEIGSSVFANNELTHVEIPDSVTSLGGAVFRNNNLTEINLPKNVTATIGRYAFAENKLTSINIPEGVVEIDYAAFMSNDLKVVNLPSSLIDIGESAFLANKIENINFPEKLKTIGERAFNKNNLVHLNIPKDVISIGAWAFAGNFELETLSNCSKVDFSTINYPFGSFGNGKTPEIVGCSDSE